MFFLSFVTPLEQMLKRTCDFVNGSSLPEVTTQLNLVVTDFVEMEMICFLFATRDHVTT